jgi:hypothetical protein
MQNIQINGHDSRVQSDLGLLLDVLVKKQSLRARYAPYPNSVFTLAGENFKYYWLNQDDPHYNLAVQLYNSLNSIAGGDPLPRNFHFFLQFLSSEKLKQFIDDYRAKNPPPSLDRLLKQLIEAKAEEVESSLLLRLNMNFNISVQRLMLNPAVPFISYNARFNPKGFSGMDEDDDNLYPGVIHDFDYGLSVKLQSGKFLFLLKNEAPKGHLSSSSVKAAYANALSSLDNSRFQPLPLALAHQTLDEEVDYFVKTYRNPPLNGYEKLLKRHLALLPELLKMQRFKVTDKGLEVAPYSAVEEDYYLVCPHVEEVGTKCVVESHLARGWSVAEGTYIHVFEPQEQWDQAHWMLSRNGLEFHLGKYDVIKIIFTDPEEETWFDGKREKQIVYPIMKK